MQLKRNDIWPILAVIAWFAFITAVACYIN
jgi:hypothetical protein